jgi:hypothetical protein
MRDLRKSTVDFLIKNFEFEYTTVMFHFVTGMMSFTVARFEGQVCFEKVQVSA